MDVNETVERRRNDVVQVRIKLDFRYPTLVDQFGFVFHALKYMLKSNYRLLVVSSSSSAGFWIIV
jgi:hypothetical protein